MGRLMQLVPRAAVAAVLGAAVIGSGVLNAGVALGADDRKGIFHLADAGNQAPAPQTEQSPSEPRPDADVNGTERGKSRRRHKGEKPSAPEGEGCPYRRGKLQLLV